MPISVFFCFVPASPVSNPCRGDKLCVCQSVSNHESHSGRIEKAKYPAFLYGSEPIFARSAFPLVSEEKLMSVRPFVRSSFVRPKF